MLALRSAAGASAATALATARVRLDALNATLSLVVADAAAGTATCDTGEYSSGVDSGIPEEISFVACVEPTADDEAGSGGDAGSGEAGSGDFGSGGARRRLDAPEDRELLGAPRAARTAAERCVQEVGVARRRGVQLLHYGLQRAEPAERS